MGVNRLSERSQKLALDVRFGSKAVCHERLLSATTCRSNFLTQRQE